MQEDNDKLRGRRSFLQLAAGAAALGLVPFDARADLRCEDTNMGRTCEAGIPSSVFHVNATPSNNRQIQSNWCWAACLEMMFRYYGHPVSQARIVQETYGTMVNSTIQPHQLLALVNRPWIDDDGTPFRVDGNSFSANLPNAAQDLANNHPLIIGTHGHAMLMTAMSYFAPWVQIWTQYGPQFVLGPAQLTGVTVRDPWPGNPNRKQLSFQAIVNAIVVVRVRVS